MIETTASKSFTAARAVPERNRISPLLWLNLVCLDAPLVAVSWQCLFARSFGIHMAHGASATLFLTAWLIYLADRFGDNLLLSEEDPASLRQEFCRRHRLAWLIVIAVIGLADFVTIATQLDAFAVSAGSMIGFAAAVYLLINRFRPSLWQIVPLKEVSIGFIFAAGTMVGLLSSLTSAALSSWLLFASLCGMNCICIAIWERRLDLDQQRISVATAFPRVTALLLPMLLLLCLTSVGVVLTSRSRALCLCVATSAFLLGALHVFREQIAVDTRTALADLVLLTPLVAIWR